MMRVVTIAAAKKPPSAKLAARSRGDCVRTSENAYAPIM